MANFPGLFARAELGTVARGKAGNRVSYEQAFTLITLWFKRLFFYSLSLSLFFVSREDGAFASGDRATTAAATKTQWRTRRRAWRRRTGGRKEESIYWPHDAFTSLCSEQIRGQREKELRTSPYFKFLAPFFRDGSLDLRFFSTTCFFSLFSFFPPKTITRGNRKYWSWNTPRPLRLFRTNPTPAWASASSEDVTCHAPFSLFFVYIFFISLKEKTFFLSSLSDTQHGASAQRPHRQTPPSALYVLLFIQEDRL